MGPEGNGSEEEAWILVNSGKGKVCITSKDGGCRGDRSWGKIKMTRENPSEGRYKKKRGD